MSANIATFEVRVKVKSGTSKEYNSELGKWVYDEMVRMFHKDARTGIQAMEKCRKYGIPLSARKVDTVAMHGDFEKFPINNNLYLNNSNAVAMDEMIWRRRNVRRDNLHRDKI